MLLSSLSKPHQKNQHCWLENRVWVWYWSQVDAKIVACLGICANARSESCVRYTSATFPDEESYNDILTYFFSTYVEGAAGREPQFPISIWNHYEAADEQSPKTTNCCEGFHNSLNAIFHCSHPSVWSLFSGLQIDMANRKLILIKAQDGQPEVKKKKYQLLHQQVAAAAQGYQAKEDKLKYLRRMANLQWEQWYCNVLVRSNTFYQ